MSRAYFLAFGLLGLWPLSGLAATPAGTYPAWFRPTLAIDHDPACAAILADVQEEFLTQGDLSQIPIPARHARQQTPTSHFFRDFQLVAPSGTDTFELPLPNGKKIFASRDTSFVRVQEIQDLVVSDMSLSTEGGGDSYPVHDDSDHANKQDLAGDIGRGHDWSILRSRAGGYYAMAQIDDNIDAYRLSLPKLTSLVCRIPLMPDWGKMKADPMVADARQAIDKLTAVIRQISRPAGPGSCGDVGFGALHDDAMTRAFDEILVRPWSFLPDEGAGATLLERNPNNSLGAYADTEQNLKDWSLGSLGNFEDWLHYQATLDHTTATLATFYQNKFGWSAPDAAAKARQAIMNAIVLEFGFYQYTPYADRPWEAQLRTAILTHQPLEKIRAIIAKTPPDSLFTDNQPETILDIAVKYPDALRLLTQHGADLNSQNAFGKTPLMYAAQYNQPDSVKILLKAGADPNLATDDPQDRCLYDLHTFGMTALHYAVRYASPAVVSALIDGGAQISAEATRSGEDNETPLDWLHRYTGGDSEHNPNINREDAKTLAVRLLPPGIQTVQNNVHKMVLKAEAQSSRGDNEGAYDLLKLALINQPDDERALSDMALVGLKAAHPRAAEDAANRMITLGSTPEIRAEAWFNKGLACEGSRGKFGMSFLPSCNTNRIAPFLNSWQLSPTVPRKNKLIAILQDNSWASCIITRQNETLAFHTITENQYDKTARAWKFDQILYVLHPANTKIPADAIVFSESRAPYRPKSANLHNEDRQNIRATPPGHVANFAVDSNVLTVFTSKETQGNVNVTVTAFGNPCNSGTP